MSDNPKRKPDEILPKYELLEETAKRVIDNIGKRDGSREIETGIDVIDEGLLGLHPSHLFIIAARPGVGKTSFALQLAWEVSKKRKTAIVSLEMTKESILERVLIQSQMLQGRSVSIGENKEKYMKNVSLWFSEVGSRCSNLKVFDSYCYTENQLYTLIEHLGYYPEVLILDHIQCIRSESRSKMFETIGNYLAYLNEIAKKNNMCVICLSQINREGDQSPSLRHLKGSGAIEEYADEVLIMDQIQPNEVGNNMIMKISKSRYGPRDLFYHMYFHGESFRFFNSKTDYSVFGIKP